MDRQQHVQGGAAAQLRQRVPLVADQQCVDQHHPPRPDDRETADVLLPLLVVGGPASQAGAQLGAEHIST
ncbi:MAG: hypothetical protein JST53_00630 [Actinobacteria bacterium]|nr:hypothetical protein [Actinomycetota bacterium]